MYEYLRVTIHTNDASSNGALPWRILGGAHKNAANIETGARNKKTNPSRTAPLNTTEEMLLAPVSVKTVAKAVRDVLE